MTEHQADIAQELQWQPIWVKDLLSWLKKIQQQNLMREEYVNQVKELLAELPGQGLPGELWLKDGKDNDVAELEEKDATDFGFLYG